VIAKPRPTSGALLRRTVTLALRDPTSVNVPRLLADADCAETVVTPASSTAAATARRHIARTPLPTE